MSSRSEIENNAKINVDEHDSDWFSINPQLPWWNIIGKCVLQLHSIPKHIAFVMDGNRRYARQHNYDNVLEWCSELGVKEVTLYAFSIENFKRDEYEVNGIMRMAEKKFENLLSDKSFVNVCLAYTSQNEISRAMKWIQRGYNLGLIKEGDIDENLINGCLDSRNALPVDMLIRTSGEFRLSDFLLWQVNFKNF